MLNLCQKDKEIIERLGYPKVIELSCGKYLVKRIDKTNGIKELLGTYIGKIININVPNNYIVEFNDNYYLLSEDLNKLGEFIPASKLFELDKENITLTEVWQILEKDNDYDANLVYEIIKMYMADILFKNNDRRLDNWGFIKYFDGSKDVVMFDFENCLNFDNDDIYLHTSENKLDYLNDFEYFLSVSSEEYLELFKQYYNIFKPSFVDTIVGKIMKDNNIKDADIKEKIMNDYNKNYELIKERMNKQKGR